MNTIAIYLITKEANFWMTRHTLQMKSIILMTDFSRNKFQIIFIQKINPEKLSTRNTRNPI